LEIRPEIFDQDYSWYFEAFIKLCTSRQPIPMASGVSQIPLSEYVALFQIMGNLESPEFDTEVLIAFDNVYVKFTNERAQAKSKAKNPPKKPPKR
jgi:hypothetical protein